MGRPDRARFWTASRAARRTAAAISSLSARRSEIDGEAASFMRQTPLHLLPGNRVDNSFQSRLSSRGYQIRNPRLTCVKHLPGSEDGAIEPEEILDAASVALT